VSRLSLNVYPVLLLLSLSVGSFLRGEEFRLSLRSEIPVSTETDNPRRFRSETLVEHWEPAQTAVIVCDVWDAHHSLNAVRRLEEFAPRMNDLLKEARRRGATIIHAPSDCMPAYEGHPARVRATTAPVAANLPPEIRFWCSRIPSEEGATYPVDQSDGGDDDTPAEHAPWAEKLKAMGRDPALPWKSQSPLIEIDSEQDYISDRGDEVWNVLEQRGVSHVILVGVHTNMCVLGRPFGLRQMVRHGKRVTLVRDLTDCMYNPARWPHVDHFTGNDLIIRHVERYVCPTITSDQILGGSPIVSIYDTRSSRKLPELPVRSPQEDWSVVNVPHPSAAGSGPAWYRCVVRLPKEWVGGEELELLRPQGAGKLEAWLNGRAFDRKGDRLTIARDRITLDDANLLVVKLSSGASAALTTVPQLSNGSERLELRGRWEHRVGDDSAWTNMPLPAKFGGSTDIYFEPK